MSPVAEKYTIQTNRGPIDFASEEEWLGMRQGWRSRLFMAIADIANKEMQRRIWLNPQKPWDWWGDIYEGFYDCLPGGSDGDLGLGYFQELGYVSEAEAMAVSALASSIDAFPASKDWTHEAILADPRWASLCTVAAKTIERLRPLLVDENELRALAEGDPEWQREQAETNT